MAKVNLWYVLAMVDSKQKYGYKRILPRKTYFKSLKEARTKRKDLQIFYNKPLVILKRQCQPLEV